MVTVIFWLQWKVGAREQSLLKSCSYPSEFYKNG